MKDITKFPSYPQYKFEKGDKFIRYDSVTDKSLIERSSETDSFGAPLLFTLPGYWGEGASVPNPPKEEVKLKGGYLEDYAPRSSPPQNIKDLPETISPERHCLDDQPNWRDVYMEDAFNIKPLTKIPNEYIMKDEAFGQILQRLDNIEALLELISKDCISEMIKKDFQDLMEKFMWPDNSDKNKPKH